ncbi:MAG: competence/damage-inducible protein A [Candidatus Zixiibacteriota bacterium]
MHVELITIGSELLAGRTLNTNAQFVGDQLARVGLQLARQISIPDDHDVIISTIRDCLTRSDWVIISGGLGPTNDDVTKKALARAFDRQLIYHDDILQRLKERFVRAGRAVNEHLQMQALLPANAEFIPNDVGTAVGILIREGNKCVVAVPGVPREMEPMIRDHIVPAIASTLSQRYETRAWSTTGLPESELYTRLEPLITAMPDVSVAFYPSPLGVKVRITAVGPDALNALQRFADQARELIGNAAYAEADIGLEEVVGQLLAEQKKTVALAESCTGGLAAKRLTDVPGSSSYVFGGFVAYDNEAKIHLVGVDRSLIVEHGAVSPEVARALAEGALAKCRTDFGIGITGIAGPSGGTDEKPVGLVWFGLAEKDRDTLTERRHFLGNREMIRERAAQHALNMLRLRLQYAV